MLERLAGNKFFCFLDGFFKYFQIPIEPADQEKTTFTCPYGTYAYRRMPFGLCNVSSTFQRCIIVIFQDMLETSMEVFMDDFSVFGDSFDSCLNNLEHMLILCKQAHLVLNWEKFHFMVTEGIMLGHKVSHKGLEIDKAKIDVIAKLPPPTNVRAVRSFLGHAGFYRRFIKDFSKISRPMTRLLEKDLVFNFNEECNKAFEILKEKLTNTPIMVSPNWPLPLELMCDASDFAVGSMLELKHYFWDEPYQLKACPDDMIKRCVHGSKTQKILDECHHGPTGGHYGPPIAAKKVFDAGFYWPTIFKEAQTLLRSKWYGPFIVKHGYPSGYVELYDKHGGSFIVNGHHVKLYHDEEQLNELTIEEIHLMCEEGRMKSIPFMAPFPANCRETMP
nr:reverse transcriptase domain-containing protein [Tanacetum cinerariifolium]